MPIIALRRGASRRKTLVSSDYSTKRVRFGSCSVRSYAQVLGEHPFCSIGCPIELGWTFEALEDISVDEYEAIHHDQVSSRSKNDLRMSWEERRAILQNYSDGEVRRALRRLYRDALGSCRSRRASTDFFSQPISNSQSSKA